MFRSRRPFRRRPPGRRPFRRLPPAVAEAERLMRSGKYDQAAAQFEQLAHKAEERTRPGAAAELYLRAARCYVEVDNLDQADGRRADDCAERAIHLFIEARQPRRVRQVLPRVLAALERHGRHDDAERLRQEVAQTFQGMAPMPGRIGRQATLPAKCASCGGPLKPDEVAWSDPQTAECPYCGGVVKAE